MENTKYENQGAYNDVSEKAFHVKYGATPSSMYYLKQANAKSYMDLGCGDGVLATQLAKEMENVKVIGLSYHQNEIDIAEENAAKTTLANGSSVSFKQHDCKKIETVEQVEMTYAMWLLCHAENPSELKNMCKCLAANTKDGGQTFLLFPVMDANWGALSRTAQKDLVLRDLKLVDFEETQGF